MSKIEVCDLCKKEIMPTFFDKAYKVTVKKLEHYYDGYAPWVQKNRQTICGKCMDKLIKSATPKPPVDGEKEK